MRDERRKEERSKQDQTNNKAKQHSTPKAVTFPKKNELPQVGLEPTTYIYMYMYTKKSPYPIFVLNVISPSIGKCYWCTLRTKMIIKDYWR